MRVSPVYRFPLHSVVTLPPLPLLTTTTTRFLSDIFRGWLSQKTPHSFFTSVLKWTIFCRLLTKDHPAVSESDRCLCNETYSFVCACVCVSLGSVFSFVASGKHWHWILIRERCSRFCVYVCDSDGRTQRYKKTSKHLLDSINAGEGGGGGGGVWIFSWRWCPCPLITYLPF